MHEIYKLLDADWDMTNVYFEPANEPNNEWYTYWEDQEAQDRLETSTAWYEMDTYFSALYDHVKFSLEPSVQVLTPPMAQGNYAETERFESCITMTIFYGQSGYELMAATYISKNDGYSWHNYWRPGREPWWYAGDPCPGSNHVLQYFPQWIQTSITSSSKPAFITEADLFSPCQDPDTGITDKDAQVPATRISLSQFVSQEQGADYVIAWLLTEFPYSVVDCPGGPANYEEIRWHQAYESNETGEVVTERPWFGPWWSEAEE
jgi:hypothetical protein